jgi:hypothetical protein
VLCEGLALATVLLVASSATAQTSAVGKEKGAVRVSASAALAALRGLEVDWSKPAWRGLASRLHSAEAWLAAHPVGDSRRIDPQNVVAGFRMHLTPWNEAETHEGQELYRLSGSKPPSDVWVIEFTNYLHGGYLAIADAASGKVVFVSELIEG